MKIRKFKHKQTGKTANEIMGYRSYHISYEETVLPSWIVENSSDWREIIEEVKKEWEITAIWNRLFNRAPIYRRNDKFNGYTFEQFFNEYNTEFEIYSAKRLIDKVEFKIGDHTNHGIITKLRINSIYKDEVTINFGEDNYGWVNDLRLQLSKQPLFTTEDGVEVYEGDTTYYVGISFMITKHRYITYHTANAYLRLKEDKETKDKCHHFSTKEAAEDYIIENKSCLSVKDILSMAIKPESDPVVRLKTSKSRLKELAKQKLNL